MSFLVSGIDWLTSATLKPFLDDRPAVDLEAIRHARGNINEIRMRLKGDEKACLALFRQAVEEGDAISQIQLSQALFGMKWGKDSAKVFALLTIEDLEPFSYYPQDFLLFNSAYDEAMEIRPNFSMYETRGKKVFGQAADRGYLPAFLELKCAEWQWRKDSYGFAVQLRPFVGKGDRLLDFFFGQALIHGCQRGSASFYEGLYWAHMSGLIVFKYPSGFQTFESFKSSYWDANVQFKSDDFLFAGKVILAPSSEAWEAFAEEKLYSVRVAPLESYSLQHNHEQIKSLLNELEISGIVGGGLVQTSEETEEIKDFHIDSLTLYSDGKDIGKISVHEETSKIYQTFQNEKIQPIIAFVENVMTRGGRASSALAWLQQIAKS